MTYLQIQRNLLLQIDFFGPSLRVIFIAQIVARQITEESMLSI